MKSPVVKLLTLVLVFVSLVLLNQSCKKIKDDSQENKVLHSVQNQLKDRFFAISDKAPLSVKKINEQLKNENNRNAFIEKIVNEVGFPLWDKAVIGVSGSSTSVGSRIAGRTNSNNDTSYVFIPIVPDSTTEVNGVFACKFIGDSLNVKYFKEKDYKKAGFNSSSPFNADFMVGFMMYIQNATFGTTSFVINDGRLFTTNSNPDSTQKRLVRISFNTNSTLASLPNISNGSHIAAMLMAQMPYCMNVFATNCGNLGYCTYESCNDPYTGLWTGNPIGSNIIPSGSGEVQVPTNENNGGGSNNYVSVSTSTQTLLQQMLLLNEGQVNLLNNYSQLSEETYNYLVNIDGDLTTEDRKAMAKSHLDLLIGNSSYLNFCIDRNQLFYSLNGWTIPWFHQAIAGSDYPDLYTNIQMLKLNNAEKAFYLLNNPALNIEVNKYLLNNSFSEEAKHTILTKLYPEQYPGISFDNITSPSNVPDDPIVDNGISVEDIPQTPPQQAGRRIGKTENRNNTEDMQFGTNGEVSGILATEVGKDNNALFSGMSNLFSWCTIRDNQLATVGNAMIEKFRTNTAPSTVFENPVLNQKVEYSAAFVNFLKLFGNRLKDRLIGKQGNINDVSEIDMGKARPIFNGFFNMTNGLQILINDTEYTEIELDEFHLDINGKWTADVTVVIYDHFGLDKLDALVYQNKHHGFADWWLLQHTRGFVPYTTKITVRKKISGHL